MAEKKTTKKTEIDKLSFEEALTKLRAMASELESGELDLEKALAGYDEAVQLASRCLSLLKEAEDRIKIISESVSGKLTLENFESEKVE